MTERMNIALVLSVVECVVFFSVLLLFVTKREIDIPILWLHLQSAILMKETKKKLQTDWCFSYRIYFLLIFMWILQIDLSSWIPLTWKKQKYEEKKNKIKQDYDLYSLVWDAHSMRYIFKNQHNNFNYLCFRFYSTTLRPVFAFIKFN